MDDNHGEKKEVDRTHHKKQYMNNDMYKINYIEYWIKVM